MAQTQIEARYGAEAGIYSHLMPKKVSWSGFPIGRKHDFTCDAGAIIPVDCFETVPGDEFDIVIRYLLKTMPLAVAPFTPFFVRTHWYYCPQEYLWRGATTQKTKGRSGSISLTTPTIRPSDWQYPPADVLSFPVGSAPSFDTPCSLYSYLCAAPHTYNPASLTEQYSFVQPASQYAIHGASENSQYTGYFEASRFVSALPFFMYQKIYRDNYVSPNLLQDNKIWFPDDVSDGWRLNYSADNLSVGYTVAADSHTIFTPDAPSSGSTPYSHTSIVPSVDDTGVNLLHLRYAMFENDRFTTALPWATRGQAPKIDAISDNSIHVYSDDGSVDYGQVVFANNNMGDVAPTAAAIVTTPANSAGSAPSAGDSAYLGFALRQSRTIPQTSDSASYPRSYGINNALPLRTNVSLGITADKLRSLLALSVWQERNARTQGSYNAMIFSHFGVDPNDEEFEPIYIGGTSDVIYFDDVLQTTPTDSSPLGTAAGRGESQGSARVGHISCKDYGYVMGVMIISPQVSYIQGIDKMWSRLTQEDFYFPEDEGLGLEEVMSDEIAVKSGISNRLFGYQERNTEYKARQNRVSGLFALPPSVDRLFGSYALARIFPSVPQLSQAFLTMSPDNMRKDWLAYPTYPAFKVSFADVITSRRPMSYQNVPNTFGF